MAAASPSWQSCLSLSHLTTAQQTAATHTPSEAHPDDDDSAWLQQNLQEQLHYSAPLPIQQRLVPILARHLQSSLPLDLSLTAPTGSGKTLCYLLPLLLFLVGRDKKHAMEKTMLRGLVLVPTRALGQQVYREALRLTAKTNIKIVQLCDEAGGSSHHAASNSTRAEGAQLVREVAPSADQPKLYYSLADLVIATPQKLLRHLDYTEGFTLRHLKLCVVDEADQLLAVGSFANLISKIIRRQEEEVKQYYDAVEREAADAARTPCPSPFAPPPLERQPGQYPILRKIMCSATLTSRIARTSEMNLHNCQYYILDSNGDVVDRNSSALPASVVATTSRTTAEGEKKHPKPSAAAVAAGGPAFALPPKLQEHIILVETKYKPAVLLKLVFELTRKISAVMWAKHEQNREAREQLKRKQLEEEEEDAQEEDAEEKREEGQGKGETHTEQPNHKSEEDHQYPTAQDVAAAGPSIIIFAGSAEDARIVGHFLANSGFANIIEFTIQTQVAERQKALLGSGGKYNPQHNPAHPHHDDASAEVDFASISDLKSYLNETIYYFPLVLVATDALVRGIDIPQVGHVINYEAPRTLQSYIHRAGRTARALRCGHVHTLLHGKRTSAATRGAPREKEETEYEAYLAKIHPFIARTLPLRYERTFFKLEKPQVPLAAWSVSLEKEAVTTVPTVDPEREENDGEADVTAPAEEQKTAEPAEAPEVDAVVAQEKHGVTTSSIVEPPTKKPFSVKWFIEEAETYMNASVLSLSDFWGSALQRQQANAAVRLAAPPAMLSSSLTSTSGAAAEANTNRPPHGGAAAAAKPPRSAPYNSYETQRHQRSAPPPKRWREGGSTYQNKGRKHHKFEK